MFTLNCSGSFRQLPRDQVRLCAGLPWWIPPKLTRVISSPDRSPSIPIVIVRIIDRAQHPERIIGHRRQVFIAERADIADIATWRRG